MDTTHRLAIIAAELLRELLQPDVCLLDVALDDAGLGVV